ncbi:MAG: murein DD-endopeptidase MepM/ murein hydrolase activator NlpD [Verrucomicrobiales bacterium]|jgi:murein DD-endopeptidase MepM/ murein hydrolase activator NlpD
MLLPLRFSFLAIISIIAATSALAGNARLVFPTPNTQLNRAPSAFYMFTDRNFEGRKSAPWQGGQYGFVRSPQRTKAGVVMTKFHEGLDIAPVQRDSSGEPRDPVMSMADGKVVHTNTTSSKSNYGRYVVVQHNFSSGPFYSLYAHLKSISVKPGQVVKAGSQLGVLGYTGVGINKRRAHVHVELNMLLHTGFDRWHDKTQSTPNHHGIFNGINMMGVDVSEILQAKRGISIQKKVQKLTPYYKVLVPNTGKLDILKRYPWLGKTSRAPAYEIALAGSGIPISITPHKKKVDYPIVSWVRYSPTYHKFFSKNRLSGSGSSAKLTKSGRQYIDLLIGAF